MTDRSPAAEPEGSEFTPAEENPWYLLATLHGDPLNKDVNFPDEALAIQNRLAWNRFMAGQISTEQLNMLKELKKADGTPRFSDLELTPYDENGLTELYTQFRNRGGTKLPDHEFSFGGNSLDHDFSCMIFPFDVDFSCSRFNGDANFINSVFLSGVNFTSAIIRYDAKFSRVTFLGNVNFSSSKFSGRAEFDESNISMHIDFTETKFMDTLKFNNALIKRDANFIEAEISSEALFLGASFLGITSFRSVNFSRMADFSSAVFSGPTDFINASFSDIASFINAKFAHPVQFDKARFKKHPPEFHGASLHEGTRWHDVTWPPIPGSRADAIDHLDNYERLKQEMERLKKHEAEQFFFIRETQCREVRDGFPKNLVSRLFGWFSDYGTSVAKPLKALAATWAICGILFENLTTMPAAKAWLFSAASLFDLLGARRNFFEAEMKEMRGFAAFVATVETAVGLVLLFLLGLALRNRFRMR
jgi:hypothetical protein